MNTLPLSKEPQPDEAEFNAFFPSLFSLSQFTSSKSDLEGADYPRRRRVAAAFRSQATRSRHFPMRPTV